MNWSKRIVPSALKPFVRKTLLFGSATASQAGQDSWVYGEVFNEMRGGYFVDVGAHDGIELSNTYLLEKTYGWDGICIEANPDTNGTGFRALFDEK